MKELFNIVNEISLSYNKRLYSETKITGSNNAAKIAREIFDNSGCEIELREYCYIMLLNRANEVLGFVKLSEGGITGTVVDVKIAFASALKALASGIIMIHNHPSGKLNPSEHDIQLTKKFRQAAELFDMAILDHIILTQKSHYSFADNGI